MRGHKVVLRQVEARDHPFFERWQNDPDLAHWMDYRTPFTLGDIDQDQERARSEGHPFTIELDGEAIGKCGLNQFRADLGVCALYVYIGDPQMRARGLGRDAVMALCAVAFDQLDLCRVELSMLSDNTRARRVYEQCGFVDGDRPGARTYRDGVWYATTTMTLDREAFSAVRAAYGI